MVCLANTQRGWARRSWSFAATERTWCRWRRRRRCGCLKHTACHRRRSASEWLTLGLRGQQEEQHVLIRCCSGAHTTHSTHQRPISHDLHTHEQAGGWHGDRRRPQQKHHVLLAAVAGRRRQQQHSGEHASSCRSLISATVLCWHVFSHPVAHWPLVVLCLATSATPRAQTNSAYMNTRRALTMCTAASSCCLGPQAAIELVATYTRNVCNHTHTQGADNVHGCYGGTAALLHAADWVAGPSWDGRLALVVATDIAVYEEGSPARATGECTVCELQMCVCEVVCTLYTGVQPRPQCTRRGHPRAPRVSRGPPFHTQIDYKQRFVRGFVRVCAAGKALSSLQHTDPRMCTTSTHRWRRRRGDAGWPQRAADPGAAPLARHLQRTLLR